MSDRREATLTEILDDPIVRLLMSSDGVTAKDVTRVMQQARVRMITGENSAVVRPWGLLPQFQCVPCKAA